MIRILGLFILLFSGTAWGLELQSFSLKSSKDGSEATAKFDGALGDVAPEVEFINETIQIDIPGARVADGKILNRIDSGKIKSLFAYQLDDTTARLRIILKSGIQAESFRDKLKVVGEDAQIRFQIEGATAALAAAKAPTPAPVVQETPLPFKVTPRDAGAGPSNTQAEESVDEKAIEAELQSLVAQKAVTTPAPPAPQAKEVQAAKSAPGSGSAEEAQIPVLSTASPKKDKSQSPSTAKVVLVLFIIAATLGGVWFFANKWMSKRNLKNPHTSIRVLTQHYLGPKKSLAIITVAGESILIGVTDHNISLIKTLALLDGEVPGQVPDNFDETLAEANESESDSVEDYAVKGVKDIVKDRLKGKRNLWA